MYQDIDILYAAWSTLHPGLNRYVSPIGLNKYFKDLKEYCSQERTKKEFYLALAQLSEKVKCSHTFLNPTNLDEEGKLNYLPKAVIPLLFSLDDKRRIIITENLSDDKTITRGDEIISINGIKSKTIIDSLLKVSRSDGLHAIDKKLSNINETSDEINSYSLFDIFFPLYFGETPTFELEISSFLLKRTYKSTITLYDLKQRMEIYKNKFGEVPTGRNLWEHKNVNANTDYMKFGTFAFWNDEFDTKKFIDSVFHLVIANKKIKNLIIDIRNNEGGDNSGDYILSYITKKAIVCNSAVDRYYKYLSIPNSLKRYLDTWDPSFKEDKEPNQFIQTSSGLYKFKSKAESCLDIIPQKQVFSGKVFLITNAKNSSAGFEMARTFKTNNLGTVIGETTGGSQQGINGGEFFFLNLPNSGIEIDVPLIFQSPKEQKPDEGIKPDIIIKTTQKDIYQQTDTQLKYILKRLKNGT
jgi:hypothetical protein